MNNEMLGSLLPPGFFRLPSSTVSKPITVTLASIKLLRDSDAPRHVLLTLLFPSAPLIFIPFFKKISSCVLSRLSLLLPTAFMQLVSPSVFQMHVTLCSIPLCVLLLSLLWSKSNILLLKDHGVFSPLALTVRTSDFKIYLKLYWYKNR